MFESQKQSLSFQDLLERHISIEIFLRHCKFFDDHTPTFKIKAFGIDGWRQLSGTGVNGINLKMEVH